MGLLDLKYHVHDGPWYSPREWYAWLRLGVNKVIELLGRTYDTFKGDY